MQAHGLSKRHHFVGSEGLAHGFCMEPRSPMLALNPGIHPINLSPLEPLGLGALWLAPNLVAELVTFNPLGWINPTTIFEKANPLLG